MAQHGGKRTPSKPAAVSGPGSYSQRTDGRPNVMDPTGLPYGEGQEFHDLQTSAPMAGSNAAPTPRPSAASSAPAMATPFDAPTTRPDEPMTAGSPFGPGATPGVQAPPDQRQKLRAVLPVLLRMADLPDTPQATRDAIRYLRGSL